MNYWILCAATSLAALFLTALPSLLLLRLATPILLRRTDKWTAAARARLLFGAQMFPAFAALSVAFGLVLPGFLELEPLASGEQLGLRLGLLAAGGAALCTLALARLWCARIAARNLARAWRRSATAVAHDGLPLLEIPGADGTLALSGIRRPVFFVSSRVRATLTASEIAAALEHERSHLLAGDNLKRLLLSLAPRVPVLREAWHAECEMAADEAALARGTPVLELASALVKVARLGGAAPRSDFATSFLCCDDSPRALQRRIRRLLHWLDVAPTASTAKSTSFRLVLGGALLLAAAAYPTVLLVAHEIIEKLV